MKKLMLLLSAGLMAFALTGCGGDDKAKETDVKADETVMRPLDSKDDAAKPADAQTADEGTANDAAPAGDDKAAQ